METRQRIRYQMTKNDATLTLGTFNLGPCLALEIAPSSDVDSIIVSGPDLQETAICRGSGIMGPFVGTFTFKGVYPHSSIGNFYDAEVFLELIVHDKCFNGWRPQVTSTKRYYFDTGTTGVIGAAERDIGQVVPCMGSKSALARIKNTGTKQITYYMYGAIESIAAIPAYLPVQLQTANIAAGGTDWYQYFPVAPLYHYLHFTAKATNPADTSDAQVEFYVY